jgi:hypothetical protein
MQLGQVCPSLAGVPGYRGLAGVPGQEKRSCKCAGPSYLVAVCLKSRVGQVSPEAGKCVRCLAGVP